MAITALRPEIRQVNYVLVHSRAPDLLRMYHRNITQNHRRRQAGKIGMPNIVARAKLIVEQRAFVPTISQRVDE
jgi:hypothetical protein